MVGGTRQRRRARRTRKGGKLLFLPKGCKTGECRRDNNPGVRARLDVAPPANRRGGKEYIRIGEATNPGPANAANRCRWGAFEMQDPEGEGFRRALAPGFGGAGARAGQDDDYQEMDGEELGHFVLRIVTVSITAWRSILALLAETPADVILVQEHKLNIEEADEARAWLRRRGWNALFSAATSGPNGGRSAGVAILTRAHLGLSLPLVGTEEVVPSRVAAGRMEAPGCRPFIAVSSYLHDGRGLARENMDILAATGAFLASQGEGCPFVAGGDYQMTPSQIAPAGFAQQVGAVLVAAGDPLGTCRTARAAREIDFFLHQRGTGGRH